MNTHKAEDVAKMFSCSKRKVTDLATQLGIGADLGGRAGYRFTDADVEKLWGAMRLPQPVEAQDPRGRRSA